MCSGKGIRVQFALSDQQYTARFCSKNTKLQTLAFELEKNTVSEEPFPHYGGNWQKVGYATTNVYSSAMAI
jgi:hypothetical protein